MGMYTQLDIGVEFKKDTPKHIIKVLEFMVDKDKGDEEDLPKALRVLFTENHELFNTARFAWMLTGCSSYYFTKLPYTKFEFDKHAGQYYLSFCADIKNYTGEWEAFLDFIAPHLQTYDEPRYIGTYMYEEWDTPQLLFADGKTIEYRTVNNELE